MEKIELVMFRGFVTNMGEYNRGNIIGEWVNFPCEAEEWEKVLKRIGVGESEEFFFTDYESEEFEGLAKELGEWENYEDLQELAERLESLKSWEKDIFEASLEVESCRSATACTWRIDTLGDWRLIEEVNSNEDLGAYYAEEGGTLNNIPENLRYYFDFEAYGRDIALEEGGTYTSKGYVVRE